jgi:hypothetical protein
MAREWNKRPSRDLVFWWWRLGRLLMGMLMSRCLLTDRNFSTSINADSLRFPEIWIAARCPYCGRNHAGRPNDASLAESIPPSETPPEMAIWHLPPAGPISRRATSRRGHLERSVPALSDALLAIGGTAKPAFRELRLRFDGLAGGHSLSDTGDTPLTPMACAAAGLKSITRPRTNGPRSLMRTTTERPV